MWLYRETVNKSINLPFLVNISVLPGVLFRTGKVPAEVCKTKLTPHGLRRQSGICPIWNGSLFAAAVESYHGALISIGNVFGDLFPSEHFIQLQQVGVIFAAFLHAKDIACLLYTSDAADE